MNPSHLFTVRVWRERASGGRLEWRGVVQHVLTRETFAFRTWNDLVAHLVNAAVKDDTKTIQPRENDSPTRN